MLPKDHIHQWCCPGLHSSDGNGKELYWLCKHPDCQAKNKRRAIEGKKSLCCTCGVESLILSPRALQRAYPQCINCAQDKISRLARKKKETVSDLFEELLMGEETR